MSHDNFKWIHDKVDALVKLRNSESFTQAFSINRNNGYKTNKVWEEVLTELEFETTAKKVACKYKDLLSRHRKELTESKRTGTSPSTWKYWNLFQDTINDNVGGAPLVKVEIGTENPIITKSKD